MARTKNKRIILCKYIPKTGSLSLSIKFTFNVSGSFISIQIIIVNKVFSLYYLLNTSIFTKKIMNIKPFCCNV